MTKSNKSKDKNVELENLQLKNEQLLNQLNQYTETNIIDDSQTKWTFDRDKLAYHWLDLLKYHHLIYYFYVFKLKKIEGFWSWILIVLSAVSTTISAFQFHEDYKEVELASKILIIIVTFCTTLIAAWIKKQGYIEKVAELDKYLLKIKRLIENLEADLQLPWNVRMEFNLFINKYKENIITFNHTAPLISPDDWKETVYMITLYYPEKALEIYPWNTYPFFSENIIDNYTFVKYNTFCKKFWSCFYCQSKCCGKTKNNREFKNYTKNLYKDKILYNDEDICPSNKRFSINNLDKNNIDNSYSVGNETVLNDNEENIIGDDNITNDNNDENKKLLSTKLTKLMDPQLRLKLPEEENLSITIQPQYNRLNSPIPSSPVVCRKSGNTTDCII